LEAHLIRQVPSRVLQVPDEPRHGLVVHILVHVEPEKALGILEKGLAQNLGRLRLADPGRADEEQRRDGAGRAAEARLGHADGVEKAVGRLGLADQPLLDEIAHRRRGNRRCGVGHFRAHLRALQKHFVDRLCADVLRSVAAHESIQGVRRPPGHRAAGRKRLLHVLQAGEGACCDVRLPVLFQLRAVMRDNLPRFGGGGLRKPDDVEKICEPLVNLLDPGPNVGCRFSKEGEGSLFEMRL